MQKQLTKKSKKLNGEKPMGAITAGHAVKENFRTEYLKTIALFSSLGPAELQQIREKIVIKKFRKNETILHEENTNEYMYIILEGEAKVVQTTEKGKDILITMHKTGDFFGELSLIDGKTAPAAVVATRDSLTAIISKREFHSLLFSHGKILDNLLKIFCARIRESIRKIQILNFNNAAQRLKMLFLLLSETYGEQTKEGTVLNIRLIHQDIADMTGLTRETVTRILDRWQRTGEIEVMKNRHILLRSEFESISF